MYCFILSTCLLIGLASSLPTEQEFPFGRIVNGVETTIEAHPYQVSIQTIKGQHFCGGSLIDSFTVVTAAHCLVGYEPNEVQVRLGSTNRKSGGELVAVRALKTHEGFSFSHAENDVAIIKLSTPVQQSAKIRAIPLADITPATGTPAVVSGWGTTCNTLCGLTTNLLEVELNVVQRNDCASSQYNYGSQIRESMICAYTEKKDSCQGDSGGPLVANGKLIGIVSWGDKCAKKDYPGVYAEVATLRNWIEQTAAEL